ncbi:MAG: DUF2505 domain-containing protein [Promicromonosporaceae bacterium]|nr:DUF2505 domain-containing protein [Promicromonosporaceae bacterium]
MHLNVQQTYAATVIAVAAMMTNEDFLQRRSRQTVGEGTIDRIDIDRDGPDGVTVIVRRTLPTDLIPAQARALVGNSVEVLQAEVWEHPTDQRAQGTVALEITGVPVRMTGTVAIEAEDDGCRVTYNGNLSANIPLFGSLVEEATATMVRRALASEEAAGRLWLKENND